MVQKRTIAFLIKIGPVFLGLLWLWHSAGLSRAYHASMAALLDWAHSALGPAGVVDGVHAQDHDIVLRLLVGTTRTSLAINAEDITSDFAMLAALYLCSPILPLWRKFAVFFPGALFALFVMHVLTVVTFAQEAFIGHPQIGAMIGYSPRVGRFLIHYNVFFEQIGMYLYVLLLWFPYILLALRGSPTEADKKKGRPG